MAGAYHLNDGRIAFRPPCVRRVIIGSDLHRVAEIDVGPLFLGHRLDLRAFFHKPIDVPETHRVRSLDAMASSR